MNVLFDDSVDFRFQRRFALHHPEEAVSNLTAMGWSASSELMQGLSGRQRDKLLLTLAVRAGFAVFITADTRFYRETVGTLTILVCDAERYAPTIKFLDSLVPSLDARLAQVKEAGNAASGGSVMVLRSPGYDPNSSAPVPGSRLASDKLRPVTRSR